MASILIAIIEFEVAECFDAVLVLASILEFKYLKTTPLW